MVLGAFDIDAPGKAATPEWRAIEAVKIAALLAAHPGLFVYQTKGGYRVLGLLSQPFAIQSEADARFWAKLYREWCLYLGNFQIEADTSCADWPRLYRLPHALRPGSASPEDLPTIGDRENVGTWGPVLSAEAISRLEADDAAGTIAIDASDNPASPAVVEAARAAAATAE
jgi:hypothetical protein